ncbi:GNAT family N-acetyltransferase [Candidatus Aenigmatarchaeota archaeon]
MIIKPFWELSVGLQDETYRLAHAVYPHESEGSACAAAFRASLDPDEHRDFFDEHHIVDIRYWDALGSDRGPVLGTVGLYHTKGGYIFRKGLGQIEEPSIWLGYWMTHPEHRRRGVGGQTIDFAQTTARDERQKTMLLYTGSAPDEAAAQVMYDERGFPIVKTWPNFEDAGYDIHIRKKSLR